SASSTRCRSGSGSASPTVSRNGWASATADPRWIGQVPVLGDEPLEVGVPGVVPDLFSCPGQGAAGSGAVLVAGVGDDDQLPQRSGPVGIVAEGLLQVVLAAQAHQVPLRARPAELGLRGVEGDHMIDVAVSGR